MRLRFNRNWQQQKLQTNDYVFVWQCQRQWSVTYFLICTCLTKYFFDVFLGILNLIKQCRYGGRCFCIADEQIDSIRSLRFRRTNFHHKHKHLININTKVNFTLRETILNCDIIHSVKVWGQAEYYGSMIAPFGSLMLLGIMPNGKAY